jgi:hypothetical protein
VDKDGPTEECLKLSSRIYCGVARGHGIFFIMALFGLYKSIHGISRNLILSVFFSPPCTRCLEVQPLAFDLSGSYSFLLTLRRLSRWLPLKRLHPTAATTKLPICTEDLSVVIFHNPTEVQAQHNISTRHGENVIRTLTPIVHLVGNSASQVLDKHSVYIPKPL